MADTHVESKSQTPPCILHIGMPKTATSTFRGSIFAKHSELLFLGKTVSNRGSYISPEFAQLLSGLKSDAPHASDELKQQLQSQIAGFRQAGRRAILSVEGLTQGTIEHHRLRAQILRELFGESRILITIRNPLDFVESKYFQFLQSFVFKHQEHEQFCRLFGKPPRFLDLNDWLSVVWNRVDSGHLSHLQVFGITQAYADVFGSEQIRILVFEQLKLDPKIFYESLSRSLGIDFEETYRLGSVKHQNQRWSAETIERLKRLDDSPWRAWFYRKFYNSKKLKALLIPDDRAPAAGKARAELNDEWREKILEFARPQFSQLAARWNLPLDQFGYPLDAAVSDVPLRRAA